MCFGQGTGVMLKTSTTSSRRIYDLI